jgi:hypothetical protein
MVRLGYGYVADCQIGIMMFLGHVLPLASKPGGAKCQRKSHQVIIYQLDHPPHILGFRPRVVVWRSNQESRYFTDSVLLAIAISFAIFRLAAGSLCFRESSTSNALIILANAG